MATLTVTTITAAGYDVEGNAVAAAAGGDSFANDPNTILAVFNGGGAAINVTIENAQPSNYGEDNDRVINVPAGASRFIVVPGFRHDDADGNVSVLYDGVTSVTVNVFRHGG